MFNSFHELWKSLINKADAKHQSGNRFPRRQVKLNGFKKALFDIFDLSGPSLMFNITITSQVIGSAFPLTFYLTCTRFHNTFSNATKRNILMLQPLLNSIVLALFLLSFAAYCHILTNQKRIQEVRISVGIEVWENKGSV